MELRDGKILGFGNRTNETDEDYHEAEEEDVDPEDKQSKDDENQSLETIPKKSESADDKLVKTNKSSKKRTEDERKVTLSAEREQIIHDLKRFYVLTKCKAFDKVNRETVNSYAERLLDLNESLGDHSEMAESFQRITDINDLFIEKDDRGKALNISKDSSSSSHSIPQIIMNTATDPNLLVEPWDGTASGYYKFERRFTSTYVNNVAYTTANQFAAFSKLIGPKGRELIEDLDPTAQGLTTAMDRIKERFAHKSHIRSEIERKLAILPVVKSEYDGAGLGALVSAAESSVKVLKHAQVSDDYIELVVFGTIGSKLPRPMFTRFLENNNFTQDITRLVAHLRTRVDNIHRSDQIISTSLNIAANAKARINTVEPQPKPTQQSFQHGRQSSSGSSPTRTNQQPRNNNRNGRQSHQQSPICRLCDGPHFTFACSQGTADTRKQMATSKQLCFRCLNKHLTPCRSNYVCPCGATHSKVLCPTGGSRPQQTTPSTPTNAQLNTSSVTLSGQTSHSTPTKSDQTGPKSGITMSIPKAGSSHASPSKRSHLKYARPELLTTYYETVVVKINNEFVRIQLDSGAGRTLILQELADRLNLKHYSNHDLNLGGFDGLSSQYSERLVTARLRSVTTNHSLNMIMCVTPRIDHRPRAVSQELWSALKQDGFELSDSPEYDQLPISIVVGSEYYRQLFKGNYIAYSEDLSVRPSIFGWVVTGTTEEDHRSSTRQPNPPFVGLIRSVIPSESRLDSEDDFMQSFDVALHSSPSADPKLALANHDFLSSTTSSNDRKLEDEFNNEFISKNVRLRDGRYSVKLDWIEPIEMDNNKQVALTRFHRLERSLETRNLTLDYNKELGEMVKNFTEPASESCQSAKSYFMPHHPVVRMDKDTTKLRVVFDASSHAAGTKSLNDNLFKGIVKWDLFDVLLRFRFGKYAMIADIEKAFLQIEVDPDDRNAFKFWWRDESGQLTIRRFKVVPFGTSISPYLLFIVLTHLFATMKNKYPEVVSVVKDRMYVDDVIIAFQNITPEELNKFRTMSAEMFSEVSMNLRKFRTNHQQLDELWAGPDRSAIAKVLGHAWTVLSDTFGPSIDISGYLPLANLTKREFTAFVQSIYNPTGIVAPFTLKLKLALRELWALKLRWDDPLPEENLKHALDLIKDAQLVNGMIAPRNLLPDDDSKVTLRVYADASEKAVAVVAYCCSSKGNFHILAKTKLARTATMPELELDALGMAAAVAHQLSMIYPFVNITICGDSKCNLQRLRQHPNKQKPSIALRIRKIAKLAPTATFRHVGTKENLADIASRGSTMEQLVAAKHWLEAPELPSSTQFEHTIATKMMTINASPADKSDACTCTRYPTYQLAVNTFRVIARILKEKFNKHSDIHELDLALILLIREVQRSHFQHHIISLDNNGNVTFDEKSVLRNGVSAHIDQYGLLRLRTRLEQTIDFSYDEVFPIILPQHCHFSRLVIANVHHQEFHPGVERTHSSIRERYFIINQRKMIKHFVNSCQLCRRKRYVASSIRHGPVPSFRYDVSTPPFTNTGIDLFGPVKVPMVDDAKVYGVIYVCATSRLVFIDAIRDMTASSVFDSVTHFVARNGLPQMFYSDNGRQLIKVKKDLQEYLNEMSRKFPDKEYRFEWQHLTAHSPWKGGFYERLIRSIKEALTTVSLDHTITSKRIADQVNGKKAKLTLEQLKHIFAEIESMINNRPLFVYEGKTICPIDFKAGQGNRQLPLACKLPARYQKPNIIRDYKSFETKVNKYRKLWKTHYILELRNFHQHTEKQKVPRTFEVGDVVHVRAPSTRLDQWPLGIVTKVFSNSDGITRAVTVRTLNRGSVVEEVKDVRNLIPVEANNERHEYVEADAPPEPEVAPPDNSPFDLPNSRLRATASRTARLQPAPKKKESLEKLAKKWTKEFQIKQKEAKYRQKLRDLISGAVAEGKPKNDPQVKDWLEELYSISTSPHCRALPSCG